MRVVSAAPILAVLVLGSCAEDHERLPDAAIYECPPSDEELPWDPTLYTCEPTAPVFGSCGDEIGFAFDGTHCVRAHGCAGVDAAPFESVSQCVRNCTRRGECRREKLRGVGETIPLCPGARCGLTGVRVAPDAPADWEALFEQLPLETTEGCGDLYMFEDNACVLDTSDATRGISAEGIQATLCSATLLDFVDTVVCLEYP
jgi:hypothetical protein